MHSAPKFLVTCTERWCTLEKRAILQNTRAATVSGLRKGGAVGRVVKAPREASNILNGRAQKETESSFHSRVESVSGFRLDPLRVGSGSRRVRLSHETISAHEKLQWLFYSLLMTQLKCRGDASTEETAANRSFDLRPQLDELYIHGLTWSGTQAWL